MVTARQPPTLVREGTRVTQVRANGETIPAERVVLATGAWSGQVADTLGVPLPVYPHRGQILHVAGTLAVDRYQGVERVQLRVLDVAVPDQGPAYIR